MKKIIPFLAASLMFISCATTTATVSNNLEEKEAEKTAVTESAKTEEKNVVSAALVNETADSKDVCTFNWSKNFIDMVIDDVVMDKKQRSTTLSAGYHKMSFIIERKESLFEYGGKTNTIYYGFNFLGGITYNMEAFFTGMNVSGAIRPDLPFIANGTAYTMTKLKTPELEKDFEIVDSQKVTRPYTMLGNVQSVIQCNAIHFKKVTEDEKIYMLKKACQSIEADALMNVFTYTKSGMTNDWVTEAIAIKYTD